MDEKEAKISGVEIREIKEADIPEISTVYAEAFNNANLGEEWSQDTAKKFIEYWFNKQRDLFFLAIKEGNIIGGIVREIKPWWDGPRLVDYELFVKPEEQQQGIATQLMRQIIEGAIEKYGVTEIEGIVDGNSDFPQNWYKNIGIVTTGLVHISGDTHQVLQHLKRVH